MSWAVGEWMMCVPGWARQSPHISNTCRVFCVPCLCQSKYTVNPLGILFFLFRESISTGMWINHKCKAAPVKWYKGIDPGMNIFPRFYNTYWQFILMCGIYEYLPVYAYAAHAPLHPPLSYFLRLYHIDRTPADMISCEGTWSVLLWSSSGCHFYILK